MDYRLTLKKLISSQYLFTGLRITLAAMLPALILYHYNVLATTSAIPLGALIIGSVDSPGPFHHRRNSILASIGIDFLVIIITISLKHNPILITAAIIVFGMFFSLIGIYGNRVNSIGLIALLVFIFNIDSKASFGNPLYNAILFCGGGFIYFLMSMLLNRIRPYRYIQLQLGESLRTLGNYTEILSGLFKENANKEYTYNRLSQLQVTIQQEQDSLREMLLSAREMIIDSTAKGRILMMMFLDSVDLFEQLISLQQDYSELKEQRILPTVAETLHQFMQELKTIGYAVQFNQPSNPHVDVDAVSKKLADAFAEERKRSLNKNTLPDFIKLRQLVFALQEAGERIKRMHRFSAYKKINNQQYDKLVNSEAKITSTEISPQLLIENLSLKSSQFRHALRVTVAMLVGYGVSLFFPLGHGYWILLTVAIILKPAYSISRTRNKQRLLGTLTGVVVGFACLYFIKNNTLMFMIIFCTMIVAYSLLKLNYYISVVCITIYVLLSFHFLNNSNFNAVVLDRLIDTLIGCAIAFIAARVVFPYWEHQQTKELIGNMVEANKKYFNAVTGLLKSPAENQKDYKKARQDAFVALANLSDNFQRLLSEKKRTADRVFFHQFVAGSYILIAHIASLYLSIERFKQFPDVDFQPLVKNINDKFRRAQSLLKGEAVKAAVSNRSAPITNKIQTLLQQRGNELEVGGIDRQTAVRSQLTAAKTVTDELEIIDSILNDELKIIQSI